jgi:hypothetical protein
MNKYMLALALIVLIGTIISIIGIVKSKGLASKFRFALIIITVTLSLSFAGFITGFWSQIGLNNSTASIYQLGIFPLFIIACCLAGSVAITIAAYLKKGFTNLKTNEGLRSGLYIGLIAGLFSGIIVGIATGFLNGKSDLIILKVQIFGPIIGLIFGYGIRAFVGHIEELANNWAKREEKLW